MADCVHIRCVGFVSCQLVPGETGTDFKRCRWCGQAVVFVPMEMMWVRAEGRVRDKLSCVRGPYGQHRGDVD